MIRVFISVLVNLSFFILSACSDKDSVKNFKNEDFCDTDYSVPVIINDSNIFDDEIFFFSEGIFYKLSKSNDLKIFNGSDFEIYFSLTNDLHYNQRFSPIGRNLDTIVQYLNNTKFIKDFTQKYNENVKYTFISLKQNKSNNYNAFFIIFQLYDRLITSYSELQEVASLSDTIYSNISRARISMIFPKFKGTLIQKENTSIELNKYSIGCDSTHLYMSNLIKGVNDIFLFDSLSKVVYKNIYLYSKSHKSY